MDKKLNKKNMLKLLFDISITIVGLVLILISPSFEEPLKISGFIIWILSAYIFIKVRNSSALIIIFGIILYVNTSLVIVDLFQFKPFINSIPEWQLPLRNSHYNILAAQSIGILMSILNLCINSVFISNINTQKSLNLIKKNNSYVYWGGLIVLLLFWAFGYAPTTGEVYVSNARPMYEYSLILFIVVWYYSGKSRKKMNILNFYGLIYIVRALSMGDRSSAFPMIVLLVLTNNIQLKNSYVLILGLIGAVFSSVIGVYRSSFSFSNVFNMFESNSYLKFLSSDTVTFSYYTAISIIASRYKFNNPAQYFVDFIGGILLGGDFKNANVENLTRPIFFNRGGGFFFSWFYFWFGIVGVIISAILLGVIIRKTILIQKKELYLFQIAIAVMVFRWYIYTPFVLFRTILFVLSVLLIIAKIVENFTTKK